ncbi:MAG: TonB-dependent receptor plug domain-containing protein, partial [Comamonas sp.]
MPRLSMPLPQDGRRAAVRRLRAPGVLAWMAAAGWLLLVAPVGAAALQPVLEARTELRSFAIAAGPLAQVIAQYANQAGVALSFDAAQIGARRSPGLQGRYAVQDGFARLLEGTELQAQRESSGVYTLRLQPLQTSQLDNVIVSAKAQIDATTESSGSYAAGRVTANIGQQLVRDIPQPVTVLTRQWLDDQALPDLHAVLRNTTGVTVDYIDSERINYYARGYQIDSLQIDGLGINQVTSAATFIQPDTAMLDRVEVLRGASGLLRGAGNPSAVVNMVRKR